MECRYLLTGGSGRLGTELRKLLPGVIAPPRQELDVTKREQVKRVLGQCRPEVVVHAAAYTDVAQAEVQKEACWQTNVEGTENICQALRETPAFLVYISTDYVFSGQRGNYREDEEPGPPSNYYGCTKLEAENRVRRVVEHLIIRTSFRKKWEYPVAFTDVHSSQEYLDRLIGDLATAVRYCHRIPFRTLHIAGPRKSFYELAKERRPEVRPGSKGSLPLPDDVSLDCRRWQALKAGLAES